MIAAHAITKRAIGLFCLIFAGVATAQEAGKVEGKALTEAAAPGGAPPAVNALQAFSKTTGTTPPAPWRSVGLPGGKIPPSTLDIAAIDGKPVLRLRSDKSYGTLSHTLAPGTPPSTTPGLLRWRWRLDQPVATADLRTKVGDDAALKVCAMFDLPLERLSFVERSLMRLARAKSGEHLPAATLCYVWDPALTPGTLLPNAYTARVRYIVLNGAETPQGQWVSHTRTLRADFLRAFGQESPEVPPLLAIVVGADSDNTQGSSLAYIGDLSLMEQ